jgi:ferrous-iron efflux pump FieF
LLFYKIPIHVNVMYNASARVIKFTVLLSIFLLGIKFVAYLKTGSLTIFASMADSFFDIVLSTANLLAVRYATKPADSDHHFGHFAIEDIASLVQAGFMTATGLFIASQIFDIGEITNRALGSQLIIISIVINVVIVVMQHFAIKKEESMVMHSERLHYLGDFLLNGVVLLSLYASSPFLDGFFALAISMYIIYNSVKVGRGAYDNLMDKALPEDDEERITQIINEAKGINGYHDIRTRRSGSRRFIQFHLEFDGDLTLREVHKITDALENDIEMQIPNSEVIIHQDCIS